LPTAIAASSVVPAQAQAEVDGVDVLIGLAVAVVMTDVVFSVRDIVAVAEDEQPGLGWAVAESIVNAPVSVTLSAITAGLAAEDEDEGVLAIAVAAPTAWASTLAAHGLWAAIDSDAHPGALFGISAVIGANLAFTMLALGSSIDGRESPPPVAVFEMLGAVPGTVIGSVELARGETKQGLWIGLTAWSGAIFAHGLVSLCVSAATDDSDDGDLPLAVPPPPPAPPAPTDGPPTDAPPPEPPLRRSPDMVQAARLVVVPTVLLDVTGSEVPAAAAVGVF
jgi:hypothetical protein